MDFESGDSGVKTEACLMQAAWGRLRLARTVNAPFHTHHHLPHALALVWDLKYGLKVAPWDQELYTMEELGKDY